jgi:hypothetical protein
MKFPKDKYTAAQRKWCEQYEADTGFDPHAMADYEAGVKTFVQAAQDSIHWFESWSSDVYLRITRLEIPGYDPFNI